MEARMKNPAFFIPGALDAILALTKAIEEKGGVPKNTLVYISARASQLNGCSVCLEAAFKKNPEGSPPPNLYAVAAWREMPYFDAAERVALALTDAITRQSEQNDGVTDEFWEEARRHYDERQLAAIVLHIAVANVWNRLNVTVRQPADAPWS